jgi:hypothetical protein
MTLTTSPSTQPSSSTTTTSSDLRSEPSPRALGAAAGVDEAIAVGWTQAESDQIRSWLH